MTTDPGARVRRAWMALVVLGAGACHTRAVPVGRVEADAGPATYGRACAPCHGARGHGDGPRAASLSSPPPDLTTLAARHGGQFPRAWVHAVVTGEQVIPPHGPREMPVWQERFGPSGGATAAASLYMQRQLEALLDYVASLQGNHGGGASVEP